MNKKEALEIIEKEKLEHYNWFGEQPKSEHQVTILEEDGKYKVYATNERGTIEGKRGIFERESEALENFMKRLRAINSLLNSRRERSRKEYMERNRKKNNK